MSQTRVQQIFRVTQPLQVVKQIADMTNEQGIAEIYFYAPHFLVPMVFFIFIFKIKQGEEINPDND